jgi:hypothetical protein
MASDPQAIKPNHANEMHQYDRVIRTRLFQKPSAASGVRLASVRTDETRLGGSPSIRAEYPQLADRFLPGVRNVFGSLLYIFSISDLLVDARIQIDHNLETSIASRF